MGSRVVRVVAGFGGLDTTAPPPAAVCQRAVAGSRGRGIPARRAWGRGIRRRCIDLPDPFDPFCLLPCRKTNWVETNYLTLAVAVKMHSM